MITQRHVWPLHLAKLRALHLHGAPWVICCSLAARYSRAVSVVSVQRYATSKNPQLSLLTRNPTLGTCPRTQEIELCSMLGWEH